MALDSISQLQAQLKKDVFAAAGDIIEGCNLRLQAEWTEWRPGGDYVAVIEFYRGRRLRIIVGRTQSGWIHFLIFNINWLVLMKPLTEIDDDIRVLFPDMLYKDQAFLPSQTEVLPLLRTGIELAVNSADNSGSG